MDAYCPENCWGDGGGQWEAVALPKHFSRGTGSSRIFQGTVTTRSAKPEDFPVKRAAHYWCRVLPCRFSILPRLCPSAGQEGLWGNQWGSLEERVLTSGLIFVLLTSGLVFLLFRTALWAGKVLGLPKIFQSQKSGH